MKPDLGRLGEVLDAPERERDDAETVAEQARERKIAVEQGRERRENLPARCGQARPGSLEPARF